MATKIVKCPNCSVENTALENYCRSCGTTLNDPFQNQQAYQNQQMQQPYNQNTGQIPGADKKLPAGILGILLGGLGIHKFMLGYQNEGIIMLVIWLVGAVLLCGIPSMVVSIIGIVEGIMYLTKSDEEFVNTYINNKKPWF